MESHFERRFQVLHFEILEPTVVRGVSGRVPLTVPRNSPRSVCLDPGVQHRAPVQLSNTVSQVLARPSEWLELFKASRKRDAFFFVLWRHNKIRPTAGFLVGIKPAMARFLRLPSAPMRPRYRALLRPSCFQFCCGTYVILPRLLEANARNRVALWPTSACWQSAGTRTNCRHHA